MVLLPGPAAIGHPWPGAANPASMPGCPLRRTCARPSDGADQNPKQSKAKQSKAKQSKAKQSKAKQSKAKQSKAKQSKAKQSKAKQSKYPSHAEQKSNVGAGLLANAVWHPPLMSTDTAPSRASPLPQRIGVQLCFSPLIRPSVSSPSAFDLAFEVHAPSRGRVEVLRSGQPGMDAGLAAPGHGWPMAAGPRSRTGARACRALARHRTKGAKALGYLPLLQVTRRKGETVSGRYRRNGYVHDRFPIDQTITATTRCS